MSLQVVPAYLAEPTIDHPAELDRNLLESMYRQTGRVKVGDFALTPLVGSLGLAISAGGAILVGNENAQQGAYFAWSDASENKSWPAPSGSPRIDALILRVVDGQYGTDPAEDTCFFEIVQGTPSGSPVQVPDSNFNLGGPNYRPGAWWRLANVRIDPTDTVINPSTTYLVPSNDYCYAPRTAIGATPPTGVNGDLFYSLTDRSWKQNVSGTWELYRPNSYYRYLSADTTPKISNTTLATESGLSLGFSAPANSVWLVTGNIYFDANTAADLKIFLDSPAGTATKVLGFNAVNTSAVLTVGYVSAVSSVAFGPESGGTSGRVQVEYYVALGSTAGGINFQWAQFVSHASNTLLKVGSHLKYERLA